MMLANALALGVQRRGGPSYVAGIDYPWRVKRVLSTSTTATGIVALYQN